MTRAQLAFLLAFLVVPLASGADAPSPRAKPANATVKAPRASDSERGEPARVQSIAIVNAGFEEVTGSAPTGWVTTQHAGVPSYEFTSDTGITRTGKRSVRVDNVGPEPFGAIYQTLPAGPYLGKRLRFSAELRARDVGDGKRGGSAHLLVQAMRTGAPVAEDRMMDRPLRGTRDWHTQSVELTIPADADHVEIGLMLLGSGSVWMDDARLVLVH